MVQLLVALVSVFAIFIVLLDAFETIILPRGVTQRYRLSNIFYYSSWKPWLAIGRRIKKRQRRESFLSFYGPLSLLMLLVAWSIVLITTFAALQWSLGAHMSNGEASFPTLVYQSGVTFFTLGYGDVSPTSTAERILAVLEAGTGFGFLALIIGYLPVFYGAFSSREVSITLMDGQAGSPPCASEMLTRLGEDNPADVNIALAAWERWAGELLESHISYPQLAYFRSQHENQSWVGALTTILDTCALIIVGIEGIPPQQAKRTFAMARHASGDLAQIFSAKPALPPEGRLTPQSLTQLRSELADAGINLHDEFLDNLRLAELRALYEPYVYSLAIHLMLDLPPWVPAADASDNWQNTAWGEHEAIPDDPALHKLSIREHNHFPANE